MTTSTTRVYTHTYTHMCVCARTYMRAHERAGKKNQQKKTSGKDFALKNSKALSFCPLVHRLPVRVHVLDTKLHGAPVRNGGGQLRNKT